jgi:hypothetical protein
MEAYKLRLTDIRPAADYCYYLATRRGLLNVEHMQIWGSNCSLVICRKQSRSVTAPRSSFWVLLVMSPHARIIHQRLKFTSLTAKKWQRSHTAIWRRRRPPPPRCRRPLLTKYWCCGYHFLFPLPAPGAVSLSVKAAGGGAIAESNATTATP